MLQHEERRKYEVQARNPFCVLPKSYSSHSSRLSQARARNPSSALSESGMSPASKRQHSSTLTIHSQDPAAAREHPSPHHRHHLVHGSSSIPITPSQEEYAPDSRHATRFCSLPKESGVRSEVPVSTGGNSITEAFTPNRTTALIGKPTRDKAETSPRPVGTSGKTMTPAGRSSPAMRSSRTRTPKSLQASLLPPKVVDLSASPPDPFENVASRLEKQSIYSSSSSDEPSITGSGSDPHGFPGQYLLKNIPWPEDCAGEALDDLYSASDQAFSRERRLRRKRRLQQEDEAALSSKTHTSFGASAPKRMKSSSREETSAEEKARQYVVPMNTSGMHNGGPKITRHRLSGERSSTRTVRASQSVAEVSSRRTSKKLSSDNSCQKSSSAPEKREAGRPNAKMTSARRSDPDTPGTTSTQEGVSVGYSKSRNTPRTHWSDARTFVRTSYNHKTSKSSRPEDPQNPEPSAVPTHDGEHLALHQPADQVTFKECLLYPLAGCLLSGFMVVCALLLFPVQQLHRERARALSSQMCVSASCLQTAKYLNNLLSWKSADTCEDFYAFVCRRWTSNSDAAAAQEYPVSFDDDYTAYLENHMYAIMQDEALESNSELKAVSALHKECMNTRRIEEEGWNPLLELMFDVSLEGFPLTPPVRSSISIWEIAAKVLRKTGSSALLGVRVTSHISHQDSVDVLSVLPPNMITASAGVDINQAIRIYTSTIFSALKVLRKEYLPPANSFTVVKFATDLERLTEVNRWRGNTPVIDVLKAPAPLLQFFVELFRGVESPLFSGEGSQVRMLAPFLTNKILNLVKETETHIVMNYLGVRLMIETSAFLPNADLTDFESTVLYARRRTNLPRWQLCVRVVEKALFPLVAVSLLTSLQKHSLRAAFSHLVLGIVEAFRHGANSSPYFDAKSRIAITVLMSTVQFRVFGPDWVKDKALLRQYVRGLPSVTSNASVLVSYVKAYEYTFLASLSRSSSQRWSRSIFSAHCWHELDPATIYVPVLLFNITQPHSEDLDGLQLARAGTRLNQCIFDLLVDLAYSKPHISESWLTEETEKRLRAADSCMYAPREEISPRFNSVRYLLAARFAYAHFRRLAWDKMTTIRLADGRDITDEQLFFVYLMLQSCRESDDIEKGQPLDGHNWEVALSNSEDFLDAFRCPKRWATSAQKCVLLTQ